MYFITHFVIFIFYYNVYYAFWSEFVSLLAVPKQININDMKLIVVTEAFKWFS